jgi:hypothetical protein
MAAARPPERGRRQHPARERTGPRHGRATAGALAVIAALAATALAGCGGGSGGNSSADPPAIAPPPGLAAPAPLRRAYPFEGRTRRVDSTVQPAAILDPWRLEGAAVPSGRGLLGVTLRYVDRGADPFPRDWARFRATDVRGREYPGTIQVPARKLFPTRPARGNPLVQNIGFVVPPGTRLARLRMTSIVSLWPFDVTWRLREPT